MIYFIRGKKSGNIKIGFSANPKKRKSNLQTSHYEELELIGIVNGSVDDEGRIKKMFSEFNIRGEWYHPAKEILSYIKKEVNMPKRDIVSSLGNGEYRITLGEPKCEPNFSYLDRNYNIRVLTIKELGLVFGVEGKKETLLRWLKKINANKKTMDKFASLMTN